MNVFLYVDGVWQKVGELHSLDGAMIYARGVCEVSRSKLQLRGHDNAVVGEWRPAGEHSAKWCLAHEG